MKFFSQICRFPRSYAVGLLPALPPASMLASMRRGVKVALLLSSLLCPFIGVPLLAQVDFGSVNIGGSTTATVTVTFPLAGTLLTSAVFTGGTPNLDFTDAGAEPAR